MPTFSASFIGSGKFYPAFSEVPEAVIPEGSLLWQYQTDLEYQPAMPRFQLTNSALEKDRRKRRSIDKEFAQLDADAREEEEREDEEPLSQATLDAIAHGQETYAADVAKQKAQMEYDAIHADELNDQLVEEGLDKIESGECDSFASATRIIEEPEETEPAPAAKPSSSNGHQEKKVSVSERLGKAKTKPKLYVKRSGKYVSASEVELRPGEAIFKRFGSMHLPIKRKVKV